MYDSTSDTLAHIRKVGYYLHRVVASLFERAVVHDHSKLLPPEKPVFDEFTPRLRGLTYGSPEYKENMSEMRVAIDHHNANNRHHPEWHEDGILGMSLVDLLEMLCDWKAATSRHHDGDIRKSIEINQKRFGYSDEFKRILLNTLPVLEAE